MVRERKERVVNFAVVLVDQALDHHFGAAALEQEALGLRMHVVEAPAFASEGCASGLFAFAVFVVESLVLVVDGLVDHSRLVGI